MIYQRIKNKVMQNLNNKIWLNIAHKNKFIKEKAIFFESYSASVFQGNVYYLYKAMFEDDGFNDYVFYVASVNPEITRNELKRKKMYDYRVKIVRYLSKEYIKELHTSKYLINNVTFPMNFVKNINQIYINTWHGTPLKCLGKSIKNDPFIIQNITRDFLSIDYLISPNQFTSLILMNDYMIKNIMYGKVLEIGYPRNIIFQNNKYYKEIRYKERLDNKNVILYMPTWRGNACGSKRKVDYISLMEQLLEKLGDSYIIYLKLHPLDRSSRIPHSKLKMVPDNYEIYEFLSVCDILITDYSSVLFDFANAHKKIYLYQFDKDEYFKERGIYKNVDNKIDFPISKNIDELSKQILFDRKKKDNVSKNFEDIFCLKTNNSTKTVIDIIKKNNLLKNKNYDNAVILIVIMDKITDNELLKIKRKYEKKK